MSYQPHCLLCRGPIDPEKITFEQRLIEDRDFCGRCFTGIMEGPYDTELDAIILPQMVAR